MTLLIDIGNSKIKLAIFQDESDLEIPRLFYTIDGNDYILINTFKEINRKYKIERVFCSSVAPRYDDIIKKASEDIFSTPATFVSLENIPIKTLNPDYALGGHDRLLAAYACANMYKEKNYDAHIVISLGTATTTNVIDKNFTFLGGMIMSGIHTSFEGLGNRTKLPIYDILEYYENKPNPIVNTTKECLEAGMFYQAIASINNAFDVTEMYLKENYDIKSINFCITGGYSNILFRHFNDKVNFHPNLVLQGLFFTNQLLK